MKTSLTYWFPFIRLLIARAACNVPRLSVQQATVRFEREFRHQQPVIVKDVWDDWPSRGWNLADWKHAFGNLTLPLMSNSLASALGGRAPTEMAASADVFQMLESAQLDDKIVFSTTRRTADLSLKRLLGQGVIRVPDIFAGVSLHSVISIGRGSAGLQYHNHEEAWLCVLYGSKRWLLRPPRMPPAEEHHGRTLLGKRSVSAHELANQVGTLDCTQQPGEAIYVPDRWYHATYNGEGGDGSVSIAFGGQATANGVLAYAAQGNVTALSVEVQKHGAQLDQLLHVAAQAGQAEAAAWLIRAGSQKDTARGDTRPGRSQPPINVGAMNGHTEIVSVLLDQGASWSIVDNDGVDAVQNAAFSGHVEVLERFVQHGVPLDKPNDQGWSLSHIAANAGHHHVLKFLRARGVSMSQPDSDGMTPVRHAAVAGHVEALEELVQFGSQVSASEVVQRGHSPVMRFLLKGGHASISERGPQGASIIHAASKFGHAGIVQALLEHRCESTIADSQRRTPLHWAAAAGHEHVVSLLLGSRANPSSVDANGKSPARYAHDMGYAAVKKAIRLAVHDAKRRRTDQSEL